MNLKNLHKNTPELQVLRTKVRNDSDNASKWEKHKDFILIFNVLLKYLDRLKCKTEKWF